MAAPKMRDKRSTMRVTRPRPKRTIEEQIQILWKVIDEAKMLMDSEMSTPEEKRRWAKVICDTMGVLKKVEAMADEKSPEDEDLGSLLIQFPRRLNRTMHSCFRRVKKWRRRNL
jgi:hypothetical protein